MTSVQQNCAAVPEAQTGFKSSFMHNNVGTPCHLAMVTCCNDLYIALMKPARTQSTANNKVYILQDTHLCNRACKAYHPCEHRNPLLAATSGHPLLWMHLSLIAVNDTQLGHKTSASHCSHY
jgi:hypothetical protein